MTTLNTQVIDRWRAAKDAKESAESVLEERKRELADAEQNALDEFERAGISQVKANGRTTFLRRDVYASVKEGRKPDVVRALRNLGLGDLVGESVNAQSLSAHVREQEKLGNALPPELAEHVTVSEVFRVRERAAS